MSKSISCLRQNPRGFGFIGGLICEPDKTGFDSGKSQVGSQDPQEHAFTVQSQTDGFSIKFEVNGF